MKVKVWMYVYLSLLLVLGGVMFAYFMIPLVQKQYIYGSFYTLPGLIVGLVIAGVLMVVALFALIRKIVRQKKLSK